MTLQEAAALKSIRGRIMAVDFGDTRTGLAVSDAGRFLASGLGYVSPGGIVKTADAVAARVRELDAVAVAVGLPVNMDGSEGARAARCREFAELLGERLDGVIIVMADERLTTVEASRYLNATDTRGKRRRAVIDSLSAELILQQVLDKLKMN